MSSHIISSASRSSPRIFIYHSSHIILIPSSFHSIILAFFTFPLIHFTMVLFAISSKLIFAHFIHHTLLFLIPSSFPSYFNSITLITTHLWLSCLFSFLYFPSFTFHSYHTSLRIFVYQPWDQSLFVRILVIALSFVVLIRNTLSHLDVLAFASDVWFENSSIEWWGNGSMSTWGLEGIGVLEAVITEVDIIRC